MALSDFDLKTSAVQQIASASAADLAAALPQYATADRPAADAVPAGYSIWNTDLSAPQFSTGADWVTAYLQAEASIGALPLPVYATVDLPDPAVVGEGALVWDSTAGAILVSEGAAYLTVTAT